MAELDTDAREKLDRRQFAFVDTDGVGHLPIHDETHIRNAMARWNQTDFPSRAAKERARRKILAAAHKHDIDVSEGDLIAKGGRT